MAHQAEPREEPTLSTFHNWSQFSSEYYAGTPLLPDEVARHVPTGTSVIAEDAIMEESGRTYHGYQQGKYFLPNDPAEQDRLDLQHATLMLLLGELALAPMTKTPHYVLDIATGTGIWALEFAEQNPTSHVIGTDLSSIQPKDRLPNCEFIKEDSEKDWVYPGIQFDYVHLRMTFTCFDDPRKVIRMAYENLNPGGWIEFQETMFGPNRMGGTTQGTAIKRWADLCNQGAMIAKGRDITCTPRLKNWLIEAGYKDVKQETYIWPVSPWPRDRRLKAVGLYNMTNMLDGFRGAGWKLLQAAGLSTPEIEQLTEDVRNEVRDPANHFYGTVYVVYGRKPFESEVGDNVGDGMETGKSRDVKQKPEDVHPMGK